MTYDEIGRRLGINKQRVEQIEKRTIRAFPQVTANLKFDAKEKHTPHEVRCV